jgi:hypothetical protein
LTNREKIEFNQGKGKDIHNNVIGHKMVDRLLDEGRIKKDIFDDQTLKIIKDECIKEANKKDTTLQFLYFTPTNEVFFITGNILKNPSFNPSSTNEWYPWELHGEYHAYPDEHPRLPYQDPDYFKCSTN